MAKIGCNSLLNGSGKLGSVVLCSWKGKPYVRALPSHVNDRKSEAQLRQRARMSLCHRMSQAMLPVVRVGFKSALASMSGYNACMSLMMKQACRVVASGVEIAYHKVLLGQGPLAIGNDVRILRSTGSITIEWNATAWRGAGSGTDVAIVGLYEGNRNQGLYSVGKCERSQGCCTINLMGDYASGHWQCYLGFLSADKDLCSNIVYVGDSLYPDTGDLEKRQGRQAEVIDEVSDDVMLSMEQEALSQPSPEATSFYQSVPILSIDSEPIILLKRATSGQMTIPDALRPYLIPRRDKPRLTPRK